MDEPSGVLLRRVIELRGIADRIPGGVLGLTVAPDDSVVDLLEAAQLVV